MIEIKIIIEQEDGGVNIRTESNGGKCTKDEHASAMGITSVLSEYFSKTSAVRVGITGSSLNPDGSEKEEPEEITDKQRRIVKKLYENAKSKRRERGQHG